MRFLIVPLVCAALMTGARQASAHPAPFSYLDLRVDASGVAGSLVVHDFDAAAVLAEVLPEQLKEAAVVSAYRDALVGIIGPRLQFVFDGRKAAIEWGAIEALPERQSLRLTFRASSTRPGHIGLLALLFPYDPEHQTFVNVYEDGTLRSQAIVDARNPTTAYYSGAAQGRLAVVRTFVLSGIEHILIGPDHVLFLVGLLLLRGTLGRLALIVTAFTLGHSLTLSLAALDIVSPPSRFVEPLIALTIIVVGADNLMVLEARAKTGRSSKDIRAALAACFGLIHGFGFASVLKEFGLPQGALGWSLFAFNLGVEIGQLMIVAVAAAALIVLARRSFSGAESLARAGSILVVLAGTFWFVQRMFFPGG